MTNSEQVDRLRVVVLFGGKSGEHDVSVESAKSVVRTLDPTKYAVRPVLIARQGDWFKAVSPERCSYERAADNRPIGSIGTFLKEQADIVLPMLHGTRGEDGTMQGFLEIIDVPYVGAGVLSSAVAMDKALFKHVMESHGIPIVPWRLVTSSALEAGIDELLQRLEAELRFPMFTKPANLGSSVGVSRCESRSQLREGLAVAAEYDRRIVVEQGISTRELEIAVIGNDVPAASIVGEIRPTRPFYDYTAKYVSGDSELLIPAPLDDEVAERARELAIKAYEAIDCAGMARVDLFLAGDNLYVNEINTIPGFTDISMFPKLWEASGLPYADQLDRLLKLGLERWRLRSSLRSTFELPEPV